MPKKVSLSTTASVRHLALGDDNTAAAYLASLYIPIIDTEKGVVKKRYEVPNQIAGLHFDENKKVIYACDDSFGLHLFDIRSDSKKKLRMNPEVENHTVNCSAMSKNYIAIGSSTFGGGIADVRVSRKKEACPHVVTIFDVRRPTDPLTTYSKKHQAEVVSMDFFNNDSFLMTGDKSGAVRSFNCERRDEDNALRWEKFFRGETTKVGLINRKIAFAVGNSANCHVLIDTKEDVEILFGDVRNKPFGDSSEAKASTAGVFKSPEYVVSMIKGISDDYPIVAVLGNDATNEIILTAIDQDGGKQAEPVATYKAHEGKVRCAIADKYRLLTGGEDGQVVIKKIDLRKDGGGKSKKEKESSKKSSSTKSSSTKPY